MNTVLVIFTGLAISLMVFFNGSLGTHTDNLSSLVIIHFTGLTLSAILYPLLQRGKVKLKDHNKIYLLAGLLGIVVVSILNITFSRGGVIVTLLGTMVGQTIAALVLEIIKKNKITFQKILSVTLIIIPAIMIGLSKGVFIGWIILSWLPGVCIFVQSYMNALNIKNIGVNKTLIFHFGTVLLALIPFILFTGGSFTPILQAISNVQKQFVFGGGSVAVIAISLNSYLLLKVKPVKLVLLMYIGQLGGALILDSIQGIEINSAYIIGIIAVVTGLIIGELKLNFKNPKLVTQKL